MGETILKVKGGDDKTVRFRLQSTSALPQGLEKGDTVLVRYQVDEGLYTLIRARHLRPREKWPAATFPVEGKEPAE
ncbi:MAG: hypothetical protein HY319_13565 [Armatimonadetes bacterium]|nr:hypothetical protein [Armatimonadota bacterium]